MISFDPPRLRAASIYQVFARNFTPEGDLDAAAERLPGIRALGFDLVYLTPVHPIGSQRRKGSLGSPYAISDYRNVDSSLGGEPALRRFMDTAHSLGLGVLMDMVFNHTSPDSLLARERPEWFWRGPDGKPGPRISDWSDVVDLDYSAPGLRDYLIETLELWARFGADGFRCDVASLVPVDFWVEARRRLAAVKPVLWLAESVHKEFVVELRRRGLCAASDPELHAAFDLSYDYDGRAEIEAAWRGEASLESYLAVVRMQESHYPAGAVKLRFLENHDQARAASRLSGARLRSWTLFAMLLPGAFMAYMGQELALEERIGLFDRQSLDTSAGDLTFLAYFAAAHAAAREAKAAAPVCDLSMLSDGVVLLERSGPDGALFAAILNLDGRSGRLALPPSSILAGRGASGSRSLLECARATRAEGATVELGPEPLFLRLA